MSDTTGWAPARMSHAWAFQVMDRVFVAVAGRKPTPCHQVKLTEYLGDEASRSSTALELALLWRGGDLKCAEVITPYVISDSFFVGRMLVESVRINHADGATEIPVRHARDEGDASGAEAARGGTSQFTGWSRASFDEAYVNAVAQIPLRGADDLLDVRVIGSGGLHGGFGGFEQRFVTVQRVNGFTTEGGSVSAQSGGCTGVIYSAEQVPEVVIVNAYGEHPTGGWQTFFQQKDIKIWPPQYDLVCIPPSGPASDVITPFHARTCFRAADRVEAVIVHDGDGEHEVKVDQAPD